MKISWLVMHVFEWNFYRSIALKELYILSIWFELIVSNVRPQIQVKRGAPFHAVRGFASKRLIRLIWFKNTFDREFQELLNKFCFIKIRWLGAELFQIFVRSLEIPLLLTGKQFTLSKFTATKLLTWFISVQITFFRAACELPNRFCWNEICQ